MAKAKACAGCKRAKELLDQGLEREAELRRRNMELEQRFAKVQAQLEVTPSRDATGG